MIEIRPLQPEDVIPAAALQRVCFPPPFPDELLWQPNHLAHHLTLFPEGQFVATHHGQVIASCTNMILADQHWLATNHDAVIGDYFLKHHTPSGSTLFGVDISVHPDHRGQGIARRLYQARFSLVRQLNLARYGTICRIPDFAVSALTNPDDYVTQVQLGIATDRTLTPLLRLGLTPQDSLPSFMEDEESKHYGVRLTWTP